MRRVFLSFLCVATLCASVLGQRKINGILGTFSPKEEVKLFNRVILRHGNFLRDELRFDGDDNLEQMFNTSKVWLADVHESYRNAGVEAVFCIPRTDSASIYVYGAMIPNSDDDGPVYSTGMSIFIYPSLLEQLKRLPKNTMVYGVGLDGLVAWAPLKFFAPSRSVKNMVSARGFYQYRYTPFPEDFYRFGVRAFYEDPERLRRSVDAPSVWVSGEIPRDTSWRADYILGSRVVNEVRFDDQFCWQDLIPASFEGGDCMRFRNWVASRIIYPRRAEVHAQEGVVVLQFVIDEDGLVNDVEAIYGRHELLVEEALRVIWLSPKWEPGTRDGKPARSKFIIPVIFRVTE